jgi:hypothetical protein
VLAVAATLWIRDTTDLLNFAVAIFGRLPIVTPVFVYPALVAAAALMVLPPLAATAVAPRPLVRPSIGTTLCLLAIAVTAGVAYAAPAYTYDQPLRRQVRVVQEAEQPAAWQVASVEPGLDLAEGAPSGWTPAPADTSLPGFSVPVRRLPHPYVFRANGPTLGPPPIAIAALSLEPVEAGSELSVSIVPRQPGLVISFVLPAGLKPARSSLPGTLRQGRWTATYVAPPPEGVVFRASVGSADAARLRELRVLATAEAGNPAWPLPAWLPQERVAWTGEATWIVAPFDLPIAPVPPLR